MQESSLSLSLSGYPTVWVAISHWLPQIVLRAFRPGPYAKLTTRVSLFSPCSLLVDTRIWATSLLKLVLRCIFCVCLFVCLFNPWLCCPLRFQNSPQTRQWEGFLVFRKFSSFTTPSQDWSSSLTLLSLFLSFTFCPTSFWREWVAFLGAWCPPSAFRSCLV